MRRTTNAIHAVRASCIAPSFALFGCVALSCGGGDGPTATAPAQIRIVSGGGQSDTVYATLPQPLVVEVRDSRGKLVEGRAVSFKMVALPGSIPSRPVYVSVTPWDTTDAQGRASTRIGMNFRAGTGGVEVSVPDLGVADTVQFTTRPGNPATLSIAPRDTAVRAGASYEMRGGVTDLSGNVIDGLAPTYTATDGVSVTSAGQVTAGSTFARGTIVATYGAFSASANVSVLMQLPIVASNAGKVIRVNTDGSGENVLDPAPDYSVSPHSVKTTTSVVYYHGDSYINSKVWVVAPAAAPRQLLPGAPGFEAWPRLSPDGVWVYFVRNNNTLWRAHLDGSSLDSLGTVSTNQMYRAPTISPDGGTVAVQEGLGVKLIDVATRAATIVTTQCLRPRYSPDGTSFVCVNWTGLVVMKTDGTNVRTLAPPYALYDQLCELSGPDWTADGKWIIGCVGGQGEVVFDVATGAWVALGMAYPQASVVR